MRISDWSSDVCSSDLGIYDARGERRPAIFEAGGAPLQTGSHARRGRGSPPRSGSKPPRRSSRPCELHIREIESQYVDHDELHFRRRLKGRARKGEHECLLSWQSRRSSVSSPAVRQRRSEEHTSELQSLMRLSNAAFVLQKNKT